jgi:hypothetical protein
MINPGLPKPNSTLPSSAAGLRGRFLSWFSIGNVDAKGLAFGFVFGFLVRLVPEVLALSSPIGWDIINYAVIMKSGVVWANWGSFFTSTWLLNSLTVPLYGLSGVDPFALLKVIAPALYGLNIAGIYWFARRLLHWDVKMSLVAIGLFAVQLASLRISWDLLRNTLGMGLLLFALPLVERVGSKRGFFGFAILSLLTVFAHEYAAVTWAVVVFGLLVWRLVKDRFDGVSVRVLLAGLPALAFLVVGMFLRFFPVQFPSAASNLLSTGEASVGRFRFMVNYFVVNDAAYSYPSYWSLVYQVALLFAFLYLPYLFLVWKGYFKNTVLNLWLGLLLVGAFGCLVLPFFALDFWARWMFMLVYPFSFYAVYGLSRIYRSSRVQHGIVVDRGSKVLAVAGLVVLFALGSGYLAIPVLAQTDNMGVILTDVSVHFASEPTVPYQDVEGVTQAMQWLNANMDNGSFVVLHNALLPWGRLYLDDSHVMVHFLNDVDEAVDLGLSKGFSRVFFVWWNEPISWFNVSFPQGFVSAESFGRISVYVYESENFG